MRAPTSPSTSQGPLAWLKAVALGTAALAVLAPGGWGEASWSISHRPLRVPVPPPLRGGSWPRHRNIFQHPPDELPNLQAFKKKNKTSKAHKHPFFLLISTDNETNRKINSPDPKTRIKLQQK